MGQSDTCETHAIGNMNTHVLAFLYDALPDMHKTVRS